MPLMFVRGDMLTAGHTAMVCPVNTVGVMGKGLARQFREFYPDCVADYITACKRGTLKPGVMLLIWSHDQCIVHFPTKQDWRNQSEYHYLKLGLDALRHTVSIHGFHDIGIPMLGCGLGGLAWDTVRPMIVRAMTPVAARTTVYIYGPETGVPIGTEWKF